MSILHSGTQRCYMATFNTLPTTETVTRQNIIPSHWAQTYLAKQDVYWESPSRNVEYGHVSEKCSKLIRVHGCGGDDEFQICASGHNLKGERVKRRDVVTNKEAKLVQQSFSRGVVSLRTDLAQQAEQHVGVQRALVSLVHDDGAVVVQVRLAQRLPEQDAVRHVLDQGFLWCAVLKTNGVAHLKVNMRFARSQEVQRFSHHISSGWALHCPTQSTRWCCSALNQCQSPQTGHDSKRWWKRVATGNSFNPNLKGRVSLFHSWLSVSCMSDQHTWKRVHNYRGRWPFAYFLLLTNWTWFIKILLHFSDWVWSLFFLAIIIFHRFLSWIPLHITYRLHNVAVGAPHAGVSPPLPGWCRSPRSLSLPHSWLPLCEVACSPPCRSWCSRPRAGTVSAGSSCRSPSPQQQSLCCCPCGCQNSYTFKSIRNLVFLHNSFESVSYRMMLRSCCLTANMGRYCLCSSRVFFLANSLLASLFSFMWSANFCSALFNGG